MKKVFLFIGLALCLASCGDDDEGNGGSGNDTFEAKIDGRAYSISGQYAWADLIADDLFAVYGSEDQTSAGFSNLFISFIGTPSVGTYDFSDTDQAVGTYLNTGSGATWTTGVSGSGTVEVTEISADRIKGTFSFKGGDGSSIIDVTEGNFDVRIGF